MNRRISMHDISSVTWLEEYKLRLKFDDGSVRDIDLQNELYGEVFEPLKEIQFFRQVKVNPDTRTIEWPNGADFAPEFLLGIGVEIEPATKAAKAAAAPPKPKTQQAPAAHG